MGKVIQTIDHEKAVLGAIMLDQGILYWSLHKLQENMFLKPEHKTIFNAIKSLVYQAKQVDMLSVRDKLLRENKLDQIGGVDYLSSLTAITEKPDFSDNIEIYVKELSSGFAPESKYVESDVQYKKQDVTVSDSSSLKQAIADAKTGFPSFISINYDTVNNVLIQLVATNISGSTLLFTTEPSKNELIKGLLSLLSGVPCNKMGAKHLDGEWKNNLSDSMDRWNQPPLWIDSTTEDIIELRGKCQNSQIKNGIQSVIIDNLTYENISRNNRGQKFQPIDVQLKEMAELLNIPVVVLSDSSKH